MRYRAMNPIRCLRAAFIFAILSFCGEIFAEQVSVSRCPVKSIVQAIKALTSRYDTLPPQLKHALELRDVFTPVVKRLDKMSEGLGPERIAEEISEINANNIHVMDGKYTSGFMKADNL